AGSEPTPEPSRPPIDGRGDLLWTRCAWPRHDRIDSRAAIL
ncbi:uncharacterized protein METZ01_LOCUS108806, partial [marine metagenome]